MQLDPSSAAARAREDLRTIVSDIMDVAEVRHVPPEEHGVIRLTGRLRMEPEAAYAQIAPRIRELGYTPLLQEDRADQVAVQAMPGFIEASRSRLWLALLLFAFTVASTIFVGSLQSDGLNLGLGLAYSASLLAILLAHEMGHFLMARRVRVAVSYPFFIPMPLPPLGTMGAFISMKEPPPDRRALLAIAIAGPLAGLVVAIPVLILGLLLSDVQSLEVATGETSTILMEGNSLLYAAIKIAVFGRFLPAGGEDVLLHPVAWAGWVGLLVTSLNLIPAGQLDGGHIFYSLFGMRTARLATWVIAGVLVLLGSLWVGWFIWAALVLLLGQVRAPLLNELTPLDKRQRMLALLGLIIFALVFTPAPLTVFELGG